MINERFFLNAPQKFKNKCYIYPPTINDIVKNENFYLYRNLIVISQEELEDEFLNKTDDKGSPLKAPTPIEYLLNLTYFNKEFEQKAKEAFMLFIQEPVTFIYEDKKILIGDLKEMIPKIKSLDELVFITEEEYFDFQNIVRESLGEKPIEKPDPNEHPKIREMKAKARYRDKIKTKKNLGISLGTSLATICCMGLGITPLNVGELSYVAFRSLIDYYQEKEKYELDIGSLLAGGDSKKIKPKYWIRNLE